MDQGNLTNPFKPGAGHPPPYLAGREKEKKEFESLLNQTSITSNMILSGLRGVGKTVLLEEFRPVALRGKWLWISNDLSESASISEENLAIRILTDLAVVTSRIPLATINQQGMGFAATTRTVTQYLDYFALSSLYSQTPGLVSDKLKAVLDFAWIAIKQAGRHGAVFVYDEAQNMSDHRQKEQFPLSVLLDVFQSIQRRGIPFLLVLTGLPILLSKLVETRTYSERMFHQVFLQQLDSAATREAIQQPLIKGTVSFDAALVEDIVKISGGYPYFVQFICREVYDTFLQQPSDTLQTGIDFGPIIRKLDNDFFAGRWDRITDRQKDLLNVIAALPSAESEFTVQEVVESSKSADIKPFGPSQVNQMFAMFIETGLLYKNRHGKYAFAVPLFAQFIRRQTAGMDL